MAVLAYGQLRSLLLAFQLEEAQTKNTVISLLARALLAHGLLLVDVDTLPPLGEEGDLGPDELPAWVLGQLDQHVVEDVLRLVAVVFVERLDPAYITDGGTAGVNERPELRN